MQFSRILVGVLALMMAACSPANTASPGPNEPSSELASTSASPGPQALTTLCTEQRRCQLDPGTYVTTPSGSDQNAFLPGLTFTLTQPWSSREHWQGELELNPLEPANIGEVRVWVDMAPAREDGTADPDADLDAAGMVAWIAANPNLVVSATGPATVAGMPATVVDFTVKPDAVSSDPLCPVGCADTVGRPHVWCCNGYGSAEHIREYILDIGTANEPHTLIIDLDSELLDILDADLQPILDSLIFPDDLIVWCGRSGQSPVPCD